MDFLKHDKQYFRLNDELHCSSSHHQLQEMIGGEGESEAGSEANKAQLIPRICCIQVTRKAHDIQDDLRRSEEVNRRKVYMRNPFNFNF